MIEESDLSVGEFFPEQLSRRGELVAWVTTLITLVGWMILSVLDFSVFIGLKLLCILLGFSALAISLGNWMDRRTKLELMQNGIHFENGLRKVTLNWDGVERVDVTPSDWGKKVSVIGTGAHFEFRTLGEVRVRDEVKGRLGFEKGEEILAHILNKAQLINVSSTEEGCSHYSKG